MEGSQRFQLIGMTRRQDTGLKALLVVGRGLDKRAGIGCAVSEGSAFLPVL